MAKQIKKICFVTPGHISSNPRLIKEVQSLTNEGHQITILFAQTLAYLKFEDEKILKNIPSVNFKIIDQSSFLQKLIQKTLKLISAKLFRVNFNSIGLDFKHYYFLKAALEHQADVYIAHNLAALPIAVKAAKKNNAKCGFDAEDFHRHEISDDINSKPYQLAKSIEDNYLTEVDYFTAASQLIAAQYRKIYPNLKPIVINNVFSIEFLQKVNDKRKCNELKLFWFSQTIGKGRGIEDAIKAIALLKRKHIILSLLGNIDDEHLIYFKNIAKELGLLNDQLIFIKPISPDEIFDLAAYFDIGLALEQAIPYNRNICLTNKIFTYLTSGLAIIASETTAQNDFISTYPKVGTTYPIGDVNALAELIGKFDEDRAFLHQTKLESSALAKEKMNWETESKKFIELIEKTLAD